MHIVGLSGSNVGSKTRTAMSVTMDFLTKKHPDAEVTMIDLANYEMVFSDGRDYRTYTGDTKYIAETIMAADAIIIGTPIFQASIPAILKIFLIYYPLMPSVTKL